MSWIDRIKTAAYTSPNGIRTSFDFTDVEESFERNASTYRFPNKSGALITSFSSAEFRYPVTAFISGSDYDFKASLFMLALYEPGIGLLEHPMYGFKTVQVISARRQDRLVSGANQAIFSIEFAETLDTSFPESITDIANLIVDSIDAYNAISATEYSDDVNYSDPVNVDNAEIRWKNNLDLINTFMLPLAITNQAVYEKYTIVFDSISNNIGSLIFTPEILASQINILLQIPAEVEDINLKINKYSSLIVALESSSLLTYLNEDARNEVIESTLTLTGCLAALTKATLFSEYKTRADAIVTAEAIRAANIFITEVIELRQRDFQIDLLNLLLYGDSDLAKAVNNYVTNAYANLTQISFNSAQQRSIITQTERTIIDLSYQLYGKSDNETLDLLISTNNLAGDQILQIPRNTEIVYYV